ncbi:MAG: winged helix-turn-helix transcriptional regulator [Candidatus Hodarchaeota archaeon]
MKQRRSSKSAAIQIEEECAVIQTLKIVGRKWMAFILSELLIEERLFFSDLLNNVRGKTGKKISAKVLSKCLDVLEEKEILSREVVQEKPLRVQYFLTEKGIDLEIIFGALKGWGIKWGGIKHKKCRSFTCIHNAVLALDIDKAKELLYSLNIEAAQELTLP